LHQVGDLKGLKTPEIQENQEEREEKETTAQEIPMRETHEIPGFEALVDQATENEAKQLDQAFVADMIQGIRETTENRESTIENQGITTENQGNTTENRGITTENQGITITENTIENRGITTTENREITTTENQEITTTENQGITTERGLIQEVGTKGMFLDMGETKERVREKEERALENEERVRENEERDLEKEERVLETTGSTMGKGGQHQANQENQEITKMEGHLQILSCHNRVKLTKESKNTSRLLILNNK